MKINYERKRFEAQVATIADLMRHGIPVVPGDEFKYEVRFGDEGPNSWTRGEALATVELIDEARIFLRRLAK